jgi:Domain of unknown function (DUF4397)
MKTVQIRKNMLLVAGALSFIALLTGCIKDVSNTPPSLKTYISIMHLAPRAPAIELYFNGAKASSAINPGIVSSSYAALDPSTFSVDFKKAGSDSLVANIQADIYDSLKFYTLLLYNIDSTHARAVKIEDDFSSLTTDKAYFRFFHMSPDIGNVDVYFDNTPVSTSREYADNVVGSYYNQFSPMTSNTYTIYVKKAGSDSVIAQANQVPLSPGGAFTIFLKGISGGTGNNAVGINVLQAASN